MIYTQCPVHGRQIAGGIIGGTGTFTMTGSATNCPVPGCGRVVPIVDGTYDLANSVLKSFRAASREELETFRDIANAVKNGEISKEQADAQVAGLGQELRQIWGWANANPAFFGVLAIVIAIWLASWQVESSNQSSVEQHADAQQQLAATQSVEKAIETETQVAASEQEVLARIYEVLQRQPALGALLVPQTHPPRAAPHLFPPQTPTPGSSGGNRHERRKAHSLARRGRQ